MNTTIATPDRKSLPLREGDYLTFTAGRIEIRVQCARVDAAYTVTVYTGTLRIEDQCTSIDNETDARTDALTAWAALAEVTA